MVELAAARGEQPVERLGLRRGARVAVEDHRHVATEFVEPFADQARYDRVGHQLARVHDRLCLKADGDRKSVVSGKSVSVSVNFGGGRITIKKKEKKKRR